MGGGSIRLACACGCCPRFVDTDSSGGGGAPCLAEEWLPAPRRRCFLRISLNNRLKNIGPSLSVRWFFSSQERVLLESNIGVYYFQKAPLCNQSDVYLPVKNRSFCNQFFGLSRFLPPTAMFFAEKVAWFGEKPYLCSRSYVPT